MSFRRSRDEQAFPFVTHGALVLFVTTILCFVLLAWRTEVNGNQIEHNRRLSEYQGCLGGTAVLTQFDQFVKKMAEIELRGTRPGSPTYDKSAVPTRLERARTYRAARINIPTCVRP